MKNGVWCDLKDLKERGDDIFSEIKANPDGEPIHVLYQGEVIGYLVPKDTLKNNLISTNKIVKQL